MHGQRVTFGFSDTTIRTLLLRFYISLIAILLLFLPSAAIGSRFVSTAAGKKQSPHWSNRTPLLSLYL